MAYRSVLIGLFSVAICLFPVCNAWGDAFSDNFANVSDKTAMDALAQDMGTLMGATSFHQGKALGFPFGFDAGVHTNFVTLQDENLVLKDNASSTSALWLQLEYGLPKGFNLIARTGKLFDADLLGAGLRWGMFDPLIPGFPEVSVSAIYTQFDHDLFVGDTVSGNVVASFNVPYIRPYVGVGYDVTRMNPDASAITNQNGNANGYRLEGGLNVSVVPFTYVTLGGGLANGKKLGHLGLGIRF